MKKWSNEYECCVWCLTVDAPHRSNGLCTRCYREIFVDVPFNTKKRKWVKREIDLVMLHKIPDIDLSRLIDRSVNAIQTKRYAIKNKR